MPEPNLQRQQTVFDLLHRLQGIEPLKQLFWSELNYDRVNKALSRRGWTSTTAGALAEDPVLFASGAANFHVIHSRLVSDKLLMGQERPVVSKLLHDHPYALFVFSNSKQDQFHFLNVKYDDDVQKRRLFRRITVGPHERLRTASERIALLDLADISPGLFGLSPLAVQQRHDEAFDVEAVTRQFFDTFAALYQRVADEVSSVSGLESRAGRLAQTLMDRMLFLYFIQKKDWLNGEPDYLYSRFKKHWAMNPKGNTYYGEVLYPLFLALSDGDAADNTVGSVPFLNGGLFEESRKLTQSEQIEQARLRISNSTFKAIFDHLLERFNFTVTEDTPLDAEVAIDPEMLGKIFESLVLQIERQPGKDLRKLTGSYYTPRAIVHFMCQESLKEYLVGQLTKLGNGDTEQSTHKVALLLSLPPAEQLDSDQVANLKGVFSRTEAAALRESILHCRVCDPAVGSGAFPLGMLHEMVGAVAKLDVCLRGQEAVGGRNYDFDLKKWVIESCLYGVDIQEQAVRLCELRLWLALVVDYQLDPGIPTPRAIRAVPALPNLSYRIVRGDSLLERLFGNIVHLEQLGMNAATKSLVESIQADKQAYFRESATAEKHRLQLKILGKQAALAEQLINAQRESAISQDHIFGESAMSARQREDQADVEQRRRQLDSLANKVRAAKASIDRLIDHPSRMHAADLDELRRKYFQTGEEPSFIWRVDFAEVFREKGGFDIVIANPPYVSFGLRGNKAAKTDWMDAIKRFYPRSAEYKVSMYAVFMDAGLMQANDDGVFCYITPDSFVLGRYFSKLRRRMLDSCHLRRFFMFEEDFWESGVVGRPTITLAARSSKTASSSLTTATLCKTVGKFLRHEWQEYSYAQAYFEGTSYNRFRLYFTEADKSFVSNVERDSAPLGRFVRFASGLIGKEGQDGIVADRKLGSTWGKGIESGGDVLPFRVAYRGKWMNFDPDKLKSGFRDAEYSRPKLFLRQTGDSLTAAYDEEGLYCLNNVHVGNVKDEQIDICYIVGLLNSELMNKYYRLISLETGRAMAQTDIDVMHELPFKVPSPEQQAKVVRLVSTLSGQQVPAPKHKAQVDEVIHAVYFGAALAALG